MSEMELQVQIDDVMACPGRCPGCALSASERRSATPDMGVDVLARVAKSVAQYARVLGPKSVNVTFGIADHLLIGEEYVHDIYRSMAGELSRAGYSGGRATIFFSASLIATRQRAVAQIDYLTGIDLVDGIPLIPVVVLDPQNLRHPKFGAQWREYAALAHGRFGRIDLALNLSNLACSLISPMELLDYVGEYGFEEVTINWTPTEGNLLATAGDLPDLTRWLVDFAELADERAVSYSYGPVMSRAANAVRCRLADASVSTVVSEVVGQTIRHSIHIDSDGSLYPKFEAIGDVPHSPRFGFEALGNVLDEPIAKILEREIVKVERRVVREHMKDRRCAVCRYLNVCGATGFHVYSHVLDGRYGDDVCPHLARAMWDQAFAGMMDFDRE